MAKTMDLPGTEGERDATLVKLVNTYIPLRDQFLALRDAMTEARDAVLERMHSLKIDKYRDSDEGLFIEIINSKDRLKISSDKADD